MIESEWIGTTLSCLGTGIGLLFLASRYRTASSKMIGYPVSVARSGMFWKTPEFTFSIGSRVAVEGESASILKVSLLGMNDSSTTRNLEEEAMKALTARKTVMIEADRYLAMLPWKGATRWTATNIKEMK